jgi:lysophospholipase L1-like esterase
MNWFQNVRDTFRMLRSSLSDSPDAWEWSIAQFEQADRVQKPPEGVVVFTGSSSITFWNTLEQDLAPLPVVNRGFGGSKIHQVARYVGRIVIPYHPRAVVLFAGTNDIAGANPKTAQDVYEGYQAFVQSVHAALPAIPIYYIGITPSPSRWNLWPIASETNRLIKTFSNQDPRYHFIDLTDHLLTAQGIPDRSLYRLDKLHPNRRGYERWITVIKPILHQDLLRQ